MTQPAATAWLLQLSEHLRVAVGVHEMIYIMPEEPMTHAIPLTPPHANRVLVWEGRLIALLDLHGYLVGTPAPGPTHTVGIVTCASADPANEAAVGALLMFRPPQKFDVSDALACKLPDELRRWQSIAASCFRHPVHGAVPILDLPALLTDSGVSVQARGAASSVSYAGNAVPLFDAGHMGVANREPNPEESTCARS